MIDHEQLQGDSPPDTIEPADVEALTGYPVEGPGAWSYGTIRFNYHRKDGEVLHYCRWRDDDGDHFYLEPVLLERDSFKNSEAGRALADFEREVPPALDRKVLLGDEPGALSLEQRGLENIAEDMRRQEEGRRTRFGAFDEGELRELWEALAMDDGIRYWPPHNSVEGALLAEIEEAMQWRGLEPPARGWTFS